MRLVAGVAVLVLAGCIEPSSPGLGATLSPEFSLKESWGESAFERSAGLRVAVTPAAGYPCVFAWSLQGVNMGRGVSYLAVMEREGRPSAWEFAESSFVVGGNVGGNHVPVPATEGNPWGTSQRAHLRSEDGAYTFTLFVAGGASGVRPSLAVSLNCKATPQDVSFFGARDVVLAEARHVEGTATVHACPPGCDLEVGASSGHVEGRFSSSHVEAWFVKVGDQAGQLSLTTPSGAREWSLETAPELGRAEGPDGTYRFELRRISATVGANVGLGMAMAGLDEVAELRDAIKSA